MGVVKTMTRNLFRYFNSIQADLANAICKADQFEAKAISGNFDNKIVHWAWYDYTTEQLPQKQTTN